MTTFNNLDNWEVILMVGYQCVVLSVFFYLISSYLGMATQGLIIGNTPGRTKDVINLLHISFNHVATLFFFISPLLIAISNGFRDN